MTKPIRKLFETENFRRRLADTLPDYLPRQRWFTSKGKQLASCTIDRVLPVTENSAIVVVTTGFDDASTESYQLPLALLDGEEFGKYRHAHPTYVLLEEGDSALVDAVPLPEFRTAIYGMIHGETAGPGGLRCEAGQVLHSAPASAPSVVPSIDTSNTAIVYNDQFFFKLFRKLDLGLNPDLELVRYLSDQAGFQHCPPYAGSIGVGEMSDDDYLNLGMMSGKVDNRGDAWAYFQTLTENFYAGDGNVDRQTRDRAALLGKRTAEMHLALHGGADAGALIRPEAMTGEYRTEITAAARKLLDRQMNELAAKAIDLSGEAADLARQVLQLKVRLDANLQKLAERPMDLDLIRIHGDYHLGQVLVTDDDFYIIDFEGEPLLSIPERRRKRPALKDVAGMVRSFHYAAHGQLLLNEKYSDADRRRHQDKAEHWFGTVSKSYLDAYYAACGDAAFLPASTTDRELLLDLFTLEKAIYEVAYELNSRPTWLGIPLRGVLRILEVSN